MSVALNPEAPEFIPKDLLETLKNGLYTMNNAAKLSNNLPVRVAYNKFRPIPDFNVVRKQLNRKVVRQINSIFKTELPLYGLKENDVEHNMEKIIGANDCIFNRIYHNTDCLKKGMTSSDLPPRDRAPSLVVPSFNTPIVTKIQVGSATFTGAKNITRPQIMFKDSVDNTVNIWVPKITEKPNNIKPLALEFQYNDKGGIIGFENPYQVELSQFQPLPEWLIPDTEEPVFPLPLSQTNYYYISTVDELNDLIVHLKSVEELAIDLEHHSYRSYQGFTCLIQMTTSAGDFIIDALATREHLHKLNLIFTDPKVLKIFHGAENDVIWLQRDFGVYIVGMFDTHQAARLLQHNSKSLSALLKRYCNIDADKTYQLADWRLRPLTADMVKYARSDTHYLAYIWRRMKSDLIEATGGQPDMLLAAFETSRQVCGLTYKKLVVTEQSHLNLYYRNKKSFNCRQMAALRMLFKWRDDQARELDESTMYLLPNHMLLSLAEKLPREIQGVCAICNPMPPFVKQHVVTIHKMMLSCRELSADSTNSSLPVGPAYMEISPPEYDVHDVEVDDSATQVLRSQECSALAELMAVVFLSCKEIEANTSEENMNPDLKLYHMDKDEPKASESDWTRFVFISPYERYKNYRMLSQQQDLQNFKEREAKVMALSRGNELIKSEVLLKMQAANPQGRGSEAPFDANVASTSGIQNKHVAVKTTRKDKREEISAQTLLTDQINKSTKRGIDMITNETGGENNPPPKASMRRYDYSSSNYMKFRIFYKSNKKYKK